MFYRRRVDTHFFRSSSENILGLSQSGYPTTNNKRHQALISDGLDQVERRDTLLRCCRNVEKNQLVDFFLIEYSDRVDGITDIGMILEFDPFNETFSFQE
jgi:hypothetical protein